PRQLAASFHPVRPTKLGILGLGAIGGSLARQAKRAGVPTVLGWSPEPAERVSAAQQGAIDDAPARAADVARAVELLVLAAPPAANLGLLAMLQPHVGAGAVITDVGSVKRAIVALARGTSEVAGLLTGEDVKSTARVLRQLGADVSAVSAGTVTVRGHRLSPPASRLHCGNSGTSARLLLGVLAGQRFPATLTGDASLRRRPMRRVTEPLRAMGAHIEEAQGDALPLTIRGGRLHALTYTT